MKVVTIVGTRPQFIKAAAVSRAIAISNASGGRPEIREIIVHTGQHFDEGMSEVFFREMQIPSPHYNLAVNSLGHGAMTGRMLEKIEQVLMEQGPEWVLVYGDTNSTLAGALAAKKLHLRVVHVEAGLRSFNLRMPEEVNRVLTDRISDLLCCPTEAAVKNLFDEGIKPPGDPRRRAGDPLVVKTGDVMQDAVGYFGEFAAIRPALLGELGLVGVPYALCTIHRAENTDSPERLTSIFTAIGRISECCPVVLPLHPRTEKMARGLKLLMEHGLRPDAAPARGLRLIRPVGYLEMIALVKQARVVLTDSGGLQKEAYFLGKPCVTLRDETEWVELVAIGANRLAGADCDEIVASFEAMKDRRIAAESELYGGGRASAAIVNLLTEHLRSGPSAFGVAVGSSRGEGPGRA